MPAMTARTGATPTAQTPAATPPPAAATPVAPVSTSRTALPTALLGGARAASPATDLAEGAATMEGGLAEGISLPPAVPTSPEASAPQFGTFTPAKSKYYPGQVVDPVSGTHYDSDTGRPVATATKQEPKKEEKVIEFIWDKRPVTMLN
jgi:hypothetical protein